jgi:hypothetical protein
LFAGEMGRLACSGRPSASASTDAHERPSWQISFPRRSPERRSAEGQDVPMRRCGGDGVGHQLGRFDWSAPLPHARQAPVRPRALRKEAPAAVPGRSLPRGHPAEPLNDGESVSLEEHAAVLVVRINQRDDGVAPAFREGAIRRAGGAPRTRLCPLRPRTPSCVWRADGASGVGPLPQVAPSGMRSSHGGCAGLFGWPRKGTAVA